MTIEDLLKSLEDAIRMTEIELENPVEYAEEYLRSLRNFAEVLEEIPEDTLKSAEITDPETDLRKWTPSDAEPGKLNKELQQGLLTDKKILPYAAQNEGDQLSLISTFVAFRLSRRKRLPNHSRQYMDWCEELRQVINAALDVTTPDFS